MLKYSVSFASKLNIASCIVSWPLDFVNLSIAFVENFLSWIWSDMILLRISDLNGLLKDRTKEFIKNFSVKKFVDLQVITSRIEGT